MSDTNETDLDLEVSSQDEAGTSKDGELSAGAGSSTAEDASKPAGPETAIDVVRDVVDKREPAAAASSASDEDGQKADEPPKAADDENFSDVPFNKHPRFQRLLTERNSYKTDAVRYQNVQTFLDQNGIEAEEAAELLTIGGLMKTNPAEAWRRMAPTVQKLLVAAGEVLPDELMKRVQAGEMSREAALEVSRSNAQVRSIGVQRTFEQQQAERRQQTERLTSVRDAAQSWEEGRRLKDPNFEAKLPALQREITYLHATEGKPENAEGVKAQLEKAYRAVNAALPPANPAPTERRQPITPVRGGQPAKNAAPQPQNTLDIIKSVVGQRGS